MAEIEIDLASKVEQQSDFSLLAAQPVSNQNDATPLHPPNESNGITNSDDLTSTSAVDSKKEAANNLPQPQNSNGKAAAHRPTELTGSRSRPAAQKQNGTNTTQQSKRRTYSVPRHAANRMVQSACEHAPKTSRAQGTKAVRREPAKLTRSQSNIDRLAKPRGETRVRPSHKCCMIAIDAFEVFRDPFNYRRARSASRTSANTQKRQKRSLSSKRHVCCQHCDVSTSPESHCAKMTCAHKVAHFCCAHCSTVHCNDASCLCEKHAHRCCAHCDAAKRLHCAATTCHHLRVHNCCAHCATAHMVTSVTCEATESAAPHCTRRECLARFATHRCCSHCDASANLHCVVRTCARIPQLRHVNTNAATATQKTTNTNANASASANARQHTSQEKTLSSNTHLRKLTNATKQQRPSEKPIGKLDGISSSKNVERKRSVAQNTQSSVSTVNIPKAPKKTEPMHRPQTIPRSAKTTEVPPPQKKKPVQMQIPKIPAAKPNAMTKSMIVQPTTTAKTVKKPDRMVTSTSALALKKKPVEPQAQPVKVVRVGRSAGKTPASNTAVERSASLNIVAESEKVEKHSADPFEPEVEAGTGQQAVLESPRANASDSETVSAAKQNEGEFDASKDSKEYESEHSKLEKAALTKFHEERIERKRRVDTILRSRVKGSQRSDSVCVEDASGAPVNAKSADEKADGHLQETSSETNTSTSTRHELQACSESPLGEGNENAGEAFHNGTMLQSDQTRLTSAATTADETAETGPRDATQHVLAENDHTNATHVPLSDSVSHETTVLTHSASETANKHDSLTSDSVSASISATATATATHANQEHDANAITSHGLDVHTNKQSPLNDVQSLKETVKTSEKEYGNGADDSF